MPIINNVGSVPFLHLLLPLKDKDLPIFVFLFYTAGILNVPVPSPISYYRQSRISTLAKNGQFIVAFVQKHGQNSLFQAFFNNLQIQLDSKANIYNLSTSRLCFDVLWRAKKAEMPNNKHQQAIMVFCYASAHFTLVCSTLIQLLRTRAGNREKYSAHCIFWRTFVICDFCRL